MWAKGRGKQGNILHLQTPVVSIEFSPKAGHTGIQAPPLPNLPQQASKIEVLPKCHGCPAMQHVLPCRHDLECQCLMSHEKERRGRLLGKQVAWKNFWACEK